MEQRCGGILSNAMTNVAVRAWEPFHASRGTYRLWATGAAYTYTVYTYTLLVLSQSAIIDTLKDQPLQKVEYRVKIWKSWVLTQEAAIEHR